MSLALQRPELVQDLIAVDNAPVDTVLSSDFPRYIEGMRKIEGANVTTQAEAERILENYERARAPPAITSLDIGC